jgi:hypothetical protein
MPTPLSWFELSKVVNGTPIVFATAWEIVPAGTTGTVVENGLNEIRCRMRVAVDDARVTEALEEWDGCVELGGHLDPGADQNKPDDSRTRAWREPSPIALR